MRRRDLLIGTGAAALARAQSKAPALVASDASRPKADWGAQVGDVVPGRAMIWSRTDRPARMLVEYSTNERFENAVPIVGPHALDVTDYTSRIDLTGLPADQQIFYRVTFRNLADGRTLSAPVTGRFRTAPGGRRNVRVLWSGDTVGQGYGINPDFGGMKIYEAMRRRAADFFIHSGDTIYADGPIMAELKQPDGNIWRNIVTEAKSKPAETLPEFRGNYLYNLLDENVRRFNQDTPQVWQWDDHEVSNNWSESKDLTKLKQYTEKSLPLLVARASRAFLEYAPLRYSDAESERIYRKIPYGPLLDVFVIDTRSYRGPNTLNLQKDQGSETVFLGRPQLQWLLAGLKSSSALWKVIASDMPIGLVVPDGRDAEGRILHEGFANGDGPAAGRELEIAELLRAMRGAKVRNTVWVTADVHYTAAHRYEPGRARFTEFDAFWEFVSGPLNAGTFGPNALDNTFGPAVVFQKHAPKDGVGAGPAAGLQFFGEIEIDGRSGEM
ncbi:MAG TPA: alkaline phosphatase D family protein [Bryobacteraceae bacterium]|nr:alkaline phosphatase D family protein [Bryobacteraceae bacterium]